jgi:23S rRNA (guanosine2251-2'-O)-methyltransferase
VATALLLYEVARRGWMRGLHGTAPAPRLVRPTLASSPPEPAPVPEEAALEVSAGVLDGPPRNEPEPPPALVADAPPGAGEEEAAPPPAESPEALESEPQDATEGATAAEDVGPTRREPVDAAPAAPPPDLRFEQDVAL